MPQISKPTRPHTHALSCTVTLNAEELQDFESRALAQLASHIALPGFRKGKAPSDMIKEKVSQTDIDEEIVRLAATKVLPQILEEQKFVPVIPPSVTLIKRDPFSLTITLIERPIAKIKNLKKLAIEKKESKVDEKDIDRTVQALLQEHRTAKPVERAVKKDDRVTANFSAVDGSGKDIPGLRANGYQILVGSEQLLPGFEEQLIGMKVNEPKSFTLTLPEKLQVEELKGKPATFTVTLTLIEETNLPELTDEFVKKNLNLPTIADLKTKIRDSIAEREAEIDRMHRERLLLDAIREQTQADIPPELIDVELRTLTNEWAQSLSQRGTTIVEELERQKRTPKQAEEDLRKQALERWKLRLGMTALIEEKKPAIDPEKLLEQGERYIGSMPESDRSAAQKSFDEKGDVYEEVSWRMKVDAVISELLA